MRHFNRKADWRIATVAICFSLALMVAVPANASEILIKIANADGVADIQLNKTNGEYISQDVKCQAFKRFVEKSSGGRIKVTIYPNCQLGGERELWEMTKQGSIQMSTCSTAVLPNFVPEVMAILIPYIFRDQNVGLKVLNGPVGQELNDLILKKIGVRVFQWQMETEYNFMTRGRSVRVPGDLKGLKIRVVENPLIVEIAKLTGATPTPIPFSEVYTSVQQGVVEGLHTGIGLINMLGLNKIINHYNLSNAWMGWGTISINEKFFQSLSPQDKYLVTQAALMAGEAYQGMSDWGRDLWVDHFIEQGKDVQILDQATKEIWVKTLRPPIIEYVKKEIGSEWVERMMKASTDAEKQLYGSP